MKFCDYMGNSKKKNNNNNNKKQLKKIEENSQPIVTHGLLKGRFHSADFEMRKMNTQN